MHAATVMQADRDISALFLDHCSSFTDMSTVKTNPRLTAGSRLHRHVSCLCLSSCLSFMRSQQLCIYNTGRLPIGWVWVSWPRPSPQAAASVFCREEAVCLSCRPQVSRWGLKLSMEAGHRAATARHAEGGKVHKVINDNRRQLGNLCCSYYHAKCLFSEKKPISLSTVGYFCHYLSVTYLTRAGTTGQSIN